ncbi:MAG TPA: hypothetical protein VFK06_24715 [Candidatus Angelobacter sp.]|nr:hypothetical protein [Candidatus Angelobacter sp.]
MPLLTHKETRERNREKALLVLRFLRTSIYSTAELLGEVMGVKSRNGIFETLQGMERKQLLRHQSFQEFTGTFTLWGITPAGQQACLQDGEEPVAVFFNTSKVSLANLQHYLSLQQIRIRAEAHGWTAFTYCDRRPVNKIKTAQDEDTINEKIRPDMLALTPQNRKVAIESERTLKWPPRYKEHVIPGHIRRVNADEYDQVIWVCRTKNDEERLRTILAAALKELKDDKELHLERGSKDYKTFNVTSIGSWPKY